MIVILACRCCDQDLCHGVHHLILGLCVCRRQARVGRARPRAAQNPAERLGDDDDDDMDVDNADVAGPSGLHSESLSLQDMPQLLCCKTELKMCAMTQGPENAEFQRR